MGGVKDHGFRFCSKACHAQKAGLIALDVRSPGNAPAAAGAIASMVPDSDDRWRRPSR